MRHGNREESGRTNATSQPMTRSSPLLKSMAAMQTKATSSSASRRYETIWVNCLIQFQDVDMAL